MKKRFTHICTNYRYHLLLLLALILLLNTVMLSGCVIRAKTPEESTPDTPKYNTIELSEDIIAEANEYLRTLKYEYEYVGVAFYEQLNLVKSGEQLHHIKFDPDNCYFVCAYYMTEAGQKADKSFDDPEKYVWVGFADETEIPEYYGDADCVGVVQINKTEFCRGIVSGGREIPTVENFMYLKPNFEDGYNTNPPKDVGEMFVYVNGSDKNNVYYYSHPKYWRATIYCTELDGEFYITESAFLENGELNTEYLTYAFGTYYDRLMSVMITDKYDAETCPYGLFKFEDIVRILNR